MQEALAVFAFWEVNKMGHLFELDISQALAAIEKLKNDLSPEMFNRVMRRTLNEVARRSHTIIDREVRKKYEVKSSWVLSKIGHHKIFDSASGVTCIIPIKGDRGSIGGTFKTLSWKRGTKARAKIVKSNTSEIPAIMPRKTPYTGKPSFQVGSLVFTRKTDARLPIVNVKGLGVPQMPEQRARPEVEAKVSELFEKRFIHNYEQIFG